MKPILLIILALTSTYCQVTATIQANTDSQNTQTTSTATNTQVDTQKQQEICLAVNVNLPASLENCWVRSRAASDIDTIGVDCCYVSSSNTCGVNPNGAYNRANLKDLACGGETGQKLYPTQADIDAAVAKTPTPTTTTTTTTSGTNTGTTTGTNTGSNTTGSNTTKNSSSYVNFALATLAVIAAIFF